MEENKETKEIKEKSEKEEKIRALTKMYYSNPNVMKALLDFALNREVVPRYFEGFGKRPDSIQYPSDITGLVKKGATSFHASEELWVDPLKINSDMSQEEVNALRKDWDLLIDIDSKYLDLSREAAKLVLELLEHYEVKNYGVKFSGSKGFHIIVSGKAFPAEYEGMKRNESFPEWPRAIVGYMFDKIKPEFRRRVGKIMSFSTLEGHSEMKVCCKNCGEPAEKAVMQKLRCSVCDTVMDRKEEAGGRKAIKCLNKGCAGIMEIEDSIEYYFCKNCKDPRNEKFPLTSHKNKESFEQMRVELADEHADFDLVLVAQRHLFRMPYSLHEKTRLASVVLNKEELENFNPKIADPFKVNIRDFYPKNTEDEGRRLLNDSLIWKKMKDGETEKFDSKKYKALEKIEIKDVQEKDFPPAIKKLLKGLKEGKKRGLFILITFLRALNFSPEYINNKIREWNKLNEPPLKEGYVKSQIDWHLRQKKVIMPPNYDNDAFYKDLGLIDKKQDVKNPISEILRKARARENYG
jgi:hypothetical protein